MSIRPCAAHLTLPLLIAHALMVPAAVAQEGPRAGADTQDTTRYAIVIGIDEYTDGSIPDLRYGRDDAHAFYDFLRSPAGGFDEGNIRILTRADATGRAIRSALGSFLRPAGAGDVVLVFLVAHALPDPFRPDDIYLLPQDARIADIAGTALPLDDVTEALAETDAGHVIVLADIGHTGSLGGPRARLRGNAASQAVAREPAARDSGYVVLTAAANNQVSQEGEEWGGGHGVFTHYLLTGLRGAADGDHDGVVNLGEILEYTRDRVRRATNNAQIPTISLTAFDRGLPMAEVRGRGEGEQ